MEEGEEERATVVPNREGKAKSRWAVASLPRFMKGRPGLHVRSEILGCAGHSGLSRQPFLLCLPQTSPVVFFFLKMASPVFL